MANKTISSIIKELSKIFKEEENLLSLSLVGSFSDPSKKIENFNDLDFVFIYEKITKENLERLRKIANYFKSRYTTKNIGVTYTFSIGPIKITSKKPKTIMIHFLVYSMEGYLKYESNLTRYSFQYYKPIIGQSLKKINHIPQIKVGDLFNNIDGIPAMKYWINKREAICIQPTIKGVKLIKVSLNKEKYLEIIFYSVLNLANNTLRLGKHYSKIDKKMCHIFKNEVPIKLNYFPEEIYSLKAKLRKKEAFSNKDIKLIKLKSLKFISECESFLKN